MLSTLLLLCSTLVVAAPDADRDAYEAAKAKVGRDPEAHVKLALWCEAHGLNAERTKHLALAVLSDPENAVARGLLGMVAFRGHWKRPDAVSEKVGADDALMATMTQYQARRARTPETADAQWKLGLWCEENGLKAEATAHFSVVTRLDPSRELAWKRLGCKKFHGFWLTEKQIAAAKEENEIQKKADKHWKPLLTKWRDGLKDKKKRDEAKKALEEVTDPRALPSIWAVFAKTGAAHQEVAVQLFGQIDAPSASQDLALLAVLSPSADVRRIAAETLRSRDARDFAGLLVNLLRDPIKYEVRPVAGPGSPGVLFIRGKMANVQRLYSPPSAPHIAPQPGDQLGVDANGLPAVFRRFISINPAFSGLGSSVIVSPLAAGAEIADLLAMSGFGAAEGQRLGQMVDANIRQTPPIFGGRSIRLTNRGEQTVTELYPIGETEIPIGEMVVEAQRAAVVAQQQLVTDVTTIERNNTSITAWNDRIRKILSTAAGSDLGEDREVWQSWYIDLLGFAVTPQMVPQQPPTFTEQVPVAYQPQVQPINIVEGFGVSKFSHSCFGRGTLVTTLNGPRAIESIQRGDLVLSQDAQTGVLSFQPVLNSIHNPPSATLRISLSGETIVVTGIHRFWKAGGGWVMARNLKVGDILRTVGGAAAVAAIASDKVQPVFNLEVVQGQSFFVGNSGTLVHDNSLVNPVPEPFDAAPDLATIASAPR